MVVIGFVDWEQFFWVLIASIPNENCFKHSYASPSLEKSPAIMKKLPSAQEKSSASKKIETVKSGRQAWQCFTELKKSRRQTSKGHTAKSS